MQGIDDRELSIPEYSEVCSYCKHMGDEKRKCAAFAEIPFPIWLGEHDHTTSYPGDGGIQFEAVEE